MLSLFFVLYYYYIRMSDKSTPKASQIVPNFVRKLVCILNDKPNSASVKWMSDGNGFKILNQQKFTTHVLPRYYRHANMPSFVRQLNMYGFHKIKDGDETFYKHPAFKKDFPELHASIYRKSEKKNSPSDSLKNSEKQNSFSQQKAQAQEKSKNKKKVSFPDSEEKEEAQESVAYKKTKRQILSNVSLKYEKKNPRQSTLLELNENSHQQLWVSKEDDNMSICENLEDLQFEQAQHFFQSTKKIIFWTPSEILSNLNNH